MPRIAIAGLPILFLAACGTTTPQVDPPDGTPPTPPVDGDPTITLPDSAPAVEAKIEGMVNPPGTLTSTVQETGAVVVEDEEQGWTVSMSMAGFGREGAVEAAGQAVRQSGDDRADLIRPNITEWYEVDGPTIEQGFDIAVAPSGDGPVRLEFEVVTELRPWLVRDTIRFSGENGHVQMIYDSLEVYDAEGATLDSWMELDCDVQPNCVITLAYDDTDAVYPVVVDPIFYDANVILNPTVGFGVAVDADDVGWDVAVDGDTAIVGIPMADDPFGTPLNKGVAIVYDFDGTSWTQRSQLFGVPGGSGTANAHAGWSVDVAGDIFAVGAPGSDQVFIFDSPTGAAVFGATQTLPAVADPVSSGDEFGWAVALDSDGDTLAVGAPNGGTLSGQGQVHVYEAVAGTFAHADLIEDSAPAAAEEFGYDVAISDDGLRVVVGAPGNLVGGVASGAVFDFEDPAGGTIAFSESQIIDEASLEVGARFGQAVALNGDLLAVGAPTANNPIGGSAVSDAGAAFLYEYDDVVDMEFELDATFISPDSEANSAFGNALDVAPSVLVVGQPDAVAFNGNADGGNAWVFNDPDDDNWVLDQEVGESTDAPLSAGEGFGFSVALGTSLFVGAPDRPDSSSPGPGIFVLDGFEADDDGDGFLTDAIESGGTCGEIACDCDDSDPAISPDATEDENDDVDEDCDGFLADCNTFNTGCAPYNIVMTEIMADPRGGQDEWFELHNTSSTKAVDLAGAIIRADSEAHVIQDNILIEPGEYAVFVNDSSLAGSTVYDTEVFSGAGVVDVAYYYDTVILPDEQATTSPELSLQAASLGPDLDSVDYNSNFTTGTSNPDGGTMSLDPDFMTSTANNTATYWCDARSLFGDGDQFGTPGAPNDECDYSYNVEFTYFHNSDPGQNIEGCTDFTFDFDATSRFGDTGNGATFIFTRTTTDPGGQETIVQFDDFVLGGGMGVTYDGTQAFTDASLSGGEITNIPDPNYSNVPGEWSIVGSCPL